MRVGRDGRFGLRLSQPGTGRSEPALEYKALGDEQLTDEAREERRLFYVAMTRAQERLILSGAAKLDGWPVGSGGGPIGWIGPALVPDLATQAERREGGVEAGVAVRFVDSEELSCRPAEPAAAAPVAAPGGGAAVADDAPPRPPPAASTVAVTELSYSAVEAHSRCGYRFYAERVLRLPPVDGTPLGEGEAGERDETRGIVSGAEPGVLGGAERGALVHELLERLDFRRPVVPDPAAVGQTLPPEQLEEILALVRAFTNSELCRRLGRATGARSEQGFAFLLRTDGEPQAVLIRGVFDVIAQEPEGRALVVDYKTDRLQGLEGEQVVQSAYGVQRLVYALAALRAGAQTVEVIHTFLELPERPAVAHFSRADIPGLEAELTRLTAAMVGGEFPVSPAPHRGLCRGCPAEGGLCSWPLAATRRGAPDQLF
jgi:hypothetical protein